MTPSHPSLQAIYARYQFSVPYFFWQTPNNFLKVGVDPNSHLALPRIPLRAICTNPKAGEILIHPQPLGQGNETS